MQNIRRAVAAGLVLAVGGMASAAMPARAATAGVGSTTTRTTVLTLQVGHGANVLDLTVLGDTGTASTDTHSAPGIASASISPLSVSSALLHLNASTPAVTTHSPGGPGDVTGQSLSLASLGIPPVLATGTVTVGALHSDFAAANAHATMVSASLDKLSLIGGGLLSIDSLGSSLGAAALSADAEGSRTVDVGTIKILDVGTLLRGLGVDVSALKLSTVSALLKTLNVPVSGLPVGADLTTYVGQLNAAVATLQSTVNPAISSATQTVDPATKTLLGTIGVTAPSTSASAAQVNQTISQVQAKLAAVLTDGLSALDATPLVQVASTSIGVNTKAADTLANSSAAVSTGPLKLTVAGVTLPVLDASAVTSAVNGALATANRALNTVTATIGLPDNLVTVSMLDKATSVNANGSYTQAVAGITGLTARIAAIDPAAVTAAVTKLAGPTVGSLLGPATAAVPLPMSAAMSALNTALGTAAPLTGGAVLQIASVAGASTYTTAAAPATGVPGSTIGSTSLPRTGGHSAIVILAGVAMLLLSLGLLRSRRLPHLSEARVSRQIARRGPPDA